jgi:hypothetical protein
VVPDHHLPSDLVELLDEVLMLKFQRPVRRCTMQAENRIVANGNPLGLVT